MKWPADGFKSTAVFKDLQYTGTKARAMNDIPTFEIRPESAKDELTVVLTNNDLYNIGTDDLEKIMCLTPGNYSVQEAKERGRHVELRIDENMINVELYEAV